MIRINLLPPEIIERRKYERFYPYVLIATAILVAGVLLSWGLVQLVVAARAEELQSTRESATQLKQDAEKLAVFELKEQELAKRQAAVGAALIGRVEMGRLAEEISLVLPEEVWVSSLQASEENGLSAILHAPNPLGSRATDGYKSVASTLVRYGSLELLTDVWLNAATIQPFSAYQGITGDAPTTQVVTFDLTAKIKRALPDTAGQ